MKAEQLYNGKPTGKLREFTSQEWEKLVNHWGNNLQWQEVPEVKHKEKKK